jgi:hypothetical protein
MHKLRRAMTPAVSRKPRRLLEKLALGAAVGAITLLLAEFAVRALMPPGRLLSPTAVLEFRLRAEQEAGMIRPDPALGHAPVLGGPVYDDFGLLREWGPREGGREAGATRFLFLGDSVTRRATLVRPLRELGGPAHEFLNAGVESWNPVQEVEFYLRHQTALRADHVVLSLHNNDLSESTVALMRDGEFTLCNPGRFVPVDPDWYTTSILYQLWVHSRHTDRLRPEHYTFRAAEVEAALARLRDEVAARGARLTVLVLPILAAAKDWQEHERRARDLSLDMLQRLGLERVDLQPACEELASNGVAVRAIPTDTYHPNDACGAMLALAAAPALFGHPAARVAGEPRVVARRGSQQLSIVAGPFLAGSRIRVVGPLRGLGFARARETRGAGVADASASRRADRDLSAAASGVLSGSGQASLGIPVPPDAAPGSVSWHAVVHAFDGEPIGWPVPMIVPRE